MPAHANEGQGRRESPEERQEELELQLEFCEIHCPGQDMELSRQGRASPATGRGECSLPDVPDVLIS